LFTRSDEADTVGTTGADRHPHLQEKAAMIKKVLTWLGIAFLIFFIAFNPNSAADVFSSLGGTIADIARGFGTFFTNLVA
jgi:lauroyl/myristoyl acyltransferase